MRQHPQPAPPKREAGLLTDLLEALSVAAALRYHYNMGAKVPGKRVFHPQRQQGVLVGTRIAQNAGSAGEVLIYWVTWGGDPET